MNNLLVNSCLPKMKPAIQIDAMPENGTLPLKKTLVFGQIGSALAVYLGGLCGLA
jgi:hypothetical protein